MNNTPITHPVCRCISTLILILAVGGCSAVGPNYTSPEPEVPVTWHNEGKNGRQQQLNMSQKWWQSFDDTILQDLIETALNSNLDIKEAHSRVREARYRRLTSRASLFPTVDAKASARKNYVHDQDSSGIESDIYAAGFDATWELDIFGGLRRSLEASQADLEAAIEDLRDVMVSLLAEVALNYVEMRTYQARLQVSLANVASQQETLELLSSLSQAGRGDELAIAQARYNLESSKAKIPDQETALEATMNRLAVLTGQSAGSLHHQLTPVGPIPQARAELVIGVPADTLRQRPDIRRAERELAAQTARIGEAEAKLYPSFSLTGSIGLESLSADDLFRFPTRVWSLGPSISWPLFNANSLRNAVNIQDELQQQKRIQYETTVLAALEEVENALMAYTKEQQKLERLEDGATAASQATKLSEYQYAAGMTGFSDVLDAQRSLLSFEDQVAQSKGTVVANLIRLYKTLGGGWQSLAHSKTSSLQGGLQSSQVSQ